MVSHTVTEYALIKKGLIKLGSITEKHNGSNIP